MELSNPNPQNNPIIPASFLAKSPVQQELSGFAKSILLDLSSTISVLIYVIQLIYFFQLPPSEREEQKEKKKRMRRRRGRRGGIGEEEEKEEKKREEEAQKEEEEKKREEEAQKEEEEEEVKLRKGERRMRTMIGLGMEEMFSGSTCCSILFAGVQCITLRLLQYSM